MRKALQLAGGPFPDEPSHHELRIGVEGDPRPDIAHADLGLAVLRNIPFLGVAEGPNLVALDPDGREVEQVLVKELLACIAEVREQLQAGIDRPPRNPGRGSDAVALDQRPDDLGSISARLRRFILIIMLVKLLD
jgi:hypothetical protein